jgi:mRNA-degrading endonuclease toxin of MazEF toxin-antitoxin module
VWSLFATQHEALLIILASVEYDYTFKHSLFIQFEALYNSNTYNNAYVSLLTTSSQVLNPKNPFLTGFSFFGNLSYPITPLFNASLAGILNPDNAVYIIIPTLSYSLSDNLDLSLIAQTFQFYSGNPALNGETFVCIRIKRPALAITDTGDGDVILARITSKLYRSENDFEISHSHLNGLLVDSSIRVHKIATIDKQRIDKRLGILESSIGEKVKNAFQKLV